MVKYDDSVIDEIIENIDLVDYVGHQLDLKQQGREYFAHCPKHIDKTPSLSITPANNKFYCFSCGRGGNIINYMMLYEGMSYEQAIEKAARLANVDLAHMCQSQTVLINRKLKKMVKRMEKEPHKILEWKEYERYKVSSVPEWESEGISPQVLRTYDIRIDEDANRIVYPVTDMEGNLINIKGRTRFENYKLLKVPKYINYYPVGVLDYFQGYAQAKDYIAESGEVKIFESIKSPMKLWEAGIRDCVSAESHNLTREQIEWLVKSGNKTAVLCWDSDVNYQNKSVKSYINLLKRFMNVYILNDKEGLLGGIEAKNSPADCGLEIWEHLYKNRQKVI